MKKETTAQRNKRNKKAQKARDDTNGIIRRPYRATVAQHERLFLLLKFMREQDNET